MARSCSSSILLLLFFLHPGVVLSLLRYRYECGERSMQLLAHPGRARAVRFKVMDEFGTHFDVANCSICLHWLHTTTDGALVFSSGYEGCHVLVKEDRYVLRVRLEETTLSGVLVASYDVNMTCPQPGDYEVMANGNVDMEPRGNGVRQSQADVLVPLSQPGLQTQNQPGLVHPGAQTQPGLRPGLQNQNQPGLVHSGAQTQPGLRPGLQTQNQHGLVHHGAQTQPGLLHQGLQTQNQPGFAHRLQTPNRPGLAHPGSQTQHGLHHPGLQTQNQPGLVHPGSQTQPGLRPGLQTQNQHGLVHHGAQTQPGFLHPGLQPQNQPGLVNAGGVQPGLAHSGAHTHTGFVRPGAQPQSHSGLLRPALQSQTGLGHLSHSRQSPGLQSRPGLLRPGLQAQLQPGLVPPGLQPQVQPNLLQPTALFYPSAGAGTQVTREQCQVAVGRMACVAPQGRDGCLQVGCCYDDMDRVAPCYYGNTATVQCLLDGEMVVVVPRGVITQPYNLDSVRLASAQPGCEPLRATDTFVMFRFPVTHCGTTVQVLEDRLIYENQLISTIDVQGSPRGGSITRDSTYILQARCIYNASELLPLRMEVAVPPPTATPLALPGPLGLQLRIATDESYTSYHAGGEHPLVRVLRDPIYVEVRLLHKTDPNLVLVLHHCWATPGTAVATEPQWPILVDGCPFVGDNYRTQLVPVGPASPQLPFPSHYQRFVISTFAFVEPPSMAVLEGEVYISCSASVCHLAQPEPCRPSCQLGVPSRARRAPGDRRTPKAMATVTSQGLLVLPKVPTLQRG
ncbi:zona pellucida sperm-binding protein 1 [Aegotheles albertisi]